MILITGATGHFGTHAIETLLQSGVAPAGIAALVRNPEKATELAAKGIEIRQGDYDNYTSLVTAFAGVDKLLMISGSDVQARMQQHENVIKAATEAGVKHLIYTSFSRKNDGDNNPLGPIASSHVATEALIHQSGIPYTFLRNALYMDVLPMFLGEQVLENGIFFPTENGKTAFALRTDLAEAAAHVLMTSGHENKSYNTTGSESLSMAEIAAMLSEVSGKQVAHHSPSAEVYAETLKGFGVPGEFVWMLGAFAEGIRQGEFDTTESHLEGLIGRKPTSMKTYMEAVYKA